MDQRGFLWRAAAELLWFVAGADIKLISIKKW